MKILNYGSLNIDYTFRVDEFVKPGQTIASLDFEKFPGGKGLNQSLALARAGAKVYHAGLIGEDGAFLKKWLEESGADCRFLKTVNTVTGSAYIQIDRQGQNCIILVGGANQTNTEEVFDDVLSGFGSGDLALFQNEVNGLDFMIDAAGAKGLKVVLNPSPMNEKALICDLSKVSMFILNEDEGCRISGEKEPGEILTAMEEKFPEAEVVLTLGEKGSVYAFKGKRIYQEAYPVKAVDTTGAGDTYTGYLLAGLAEGLSVKEAMSLAAMASSIAVTKKGAASSIPFRDEVRKAYTEGYVQNG